MMSDENAHVAIRCGGASEAAPKIMVALLAKRRFDRRRLGDVD
jgi:hypothetical protein